uniref:Uncharacterized protein n=1 Tax=Arundo donax TaxID=35708 RepID=A0A0A8XMU3_ARUDO
MGFNQKPIRIPLFDTRFLCLILGKLSPCLAVCAKY